MRWQVAFLEKGDGHNRPSEATTFQQKMRMVAPAAIFISSFFDFCVFLRLAGPAGIDR